MSSTSNAVGGLRDDVLRPGDVVDGRYRIDALLGDGGMALVYRATHVLLDTRVAIKVMSPHLRTAGGLIERFVREARVATQLRGEHVVRAFDVGALPNGLPFLVMEYLEGSDLGAVLTSLGPLTVDDAVEYVLQACDALAEVHGVGIVHRDLKPANLFIARGTDGRPCLKLIDFGISCFFESSGAALPMRVTRPQVVLGSPGYMSPEQMDSTRTVDARSDIYGIGAVLYELLTGQTPYHGDTFPDLCVAMMKGPPPAPSSLVGGIPAKLDEVVLRCLRSDAAERYPDVAALAAALVPFTTSRADRSARVETIACVLLASQTRGHDGDTELDIRANPRSSGVRRRVSSRHVGSAGSRWVGRAVWGTITAAAIAATAFGVRGFGVSGLGARLASIAAYRANVAKVTEPRSIASATMATAAAAIVAPEPSASSTEEVIELLPEEPAPRMVPTGKSSPPVKATPSRRAAASSSPTIEHPVLAAPDAGTRDERLEARTPETILDTPPRAEGESESPRQTLGAEGAAL